MTDKAKHTFYFAIKGCARCGETHDNLKAVKFDRPPSDGYEYWATCPESGDPILVSVQASGEGV